MTKDDKKIITEARIYAYNQLFNELKPWIVKYNQACKEVMANWQGYQQAYDVFAKYGLGQKVYKSYLTYDFEWNWELKDLNNKIMRSYKF